MHYRKIPNLSFPTLNQCDAVVYEITTGNECCEYLTVPNGKIGYSVVLEGTATIYRDGEWAGIPSTTVYGLIKKPQLIRISNNFREISVGLSPYLLQLFVRESMSVITGGNTINLIDLFSADEVEQLEENLRNSNADLELLAALETFLWKSLIPEKMNKRLSKATELISSTAANNVEDLASSLNMSGTNLRNIFRDYVGVSPKDLIRITRIHKALNHDIDTEESLTQLGYRLGYFDQAHFIHDFKNIIGITPKKYFRNKSLGFDFYNFGRWRGDNFGFV